MATILGPLGIEGVTAKREALKLSRWQTASLVDMSPWRLTRAERGECRLTPCELATLHAALTTMERAYARARRQARALQSA